MSENWQIRLLYDGHCPLCKREAKLLRRRVRHGEVLLEDYTAPDFDADRYGVEREALDKRIHGVLPNGQIVTGVEAFRVAYRALGWGWLIAPTGWPVLRWVFDGLYAVFAKIRPRLQGRCQPGDACAIERDG